MYNSAAVTSGLDAAFVNTIFRILKGIKVNCPIIEYVPVQFYNFFYYRGAYSHDRKWLASSLGNANMLFNISEQDKNLKYALINVKISAFKNDSGAFLFCL